MGFADATGLAEPTSLADLRTPALLVDLDAVDANIAAMQRVLAGSPVHLRPHFKNHCCVDLSQQQMAAGAIGISVARLRHAELLASHGIRSILMTAGIADAAEAERAAALAAKIELLLPMDCPEMIAVLASAAVARGIRLDVVIEIDLGLHRTGIAAQQAPALLSLIQREPHLRLRGLSAYEGHLQRLSPGDEKDAACSAAYRTLAEVRSACERPDLPLNIVSAGGTGTCLQAANSGVLTELQAGCYLFSELNYQASAPQFTPALTVLATVLAAYPDRLILNAGLKALSGERGLGGVLDAPDLQVTALHAEHAIVARLDGAPQHRVGDRLRLTVPYSDGTVHLHRRMWGHRGDRVESELQIVE